MRITCPHCDTGLKVAERPDDDAVIKCPRCKKPFVLGPPDGGDDEDDEQAASRKPVRRRREDDDDRPVRRKKARDSDDDDDDRPARKKAGKAKTPVAAIVGVGVAVLGVIAVVVVLAVGDRKKPADDDAGAGPVYVPPPPPPGPSELKLAVAELFREAAGADRGKFVPTLEPVGADPVVPAFAALRGAGEPAAAPKVDPGKVVDEVSKSTVFIRLGEGLGTSSGSGFVIRADGTTAIVATNHHVVHQAIEAGSQAAKLFVVFYSGVPGSEQQLPATVIAHDDDADLALLRVPSVRRMPPALDPLAAPPPAATMPVLLCGFPLGAFEAANGQNPAISIGTGAVSSIKKTRSGEVDKIQIDGVLNPGNSGGPVVERATGRLVGVAVQTVRPGVGQGLGYAVPVPKLVALSEGRVQGPTFTGAAVEGGETPFQVDVPVGDPFGRVKGVALYVLPAGAAPAGVKNPATGWEPMAGATKLDLKLEDGKATGLLRLPVAGDKSAVGVQVACTAKDGTVAVSAPVTFTLTREGARSAGEAVAVSALNRNPGKYAGQTVVARGKMMPAPSPMFDVFELTVLNETDGQARNLQFLTSKDIADQLNELPTLPIALPVHLECKVGKAANGRTLVRVSRIGILGKGNKPALTIPSDALEKLDPLIALNRNSDKFVGQTLTVNVLLGPDVLTRPAGPELVVAFLATRRQADNLSFHASAEIVSQWTGEGHGGAVQAALSVKVEDRKTPDGRRIVTVQRIDVVVNGKKKTIE